MSASNYNQNANHNHTPSNGSSDDDFVVVNASQELSVRSKEPESQTIPRIALNTIPAEDAFLVSIQPPAAPVNGIKHVPCDIVLVIDVSGSMAELAPLPDTQDEVERESAGLTVLDLVRHASRTIISTLNEGDRLALVTFSQDAEVVQPLICMTEEAKTDTLDKIEKLKDQGATNLWAGIKAGLQQFEQNKPIGNVQGLFVLTDGQPNYMCPPQGYVPKLKPILEDLRSSTSSAPTIQTFGFGYTIRSDLMLSIAEVGNGNFAFIPEVGMIGTVFVHAVANLYATFATNAVVELKIPESRSGHLKHNSGLPIEQISPSHLRIKLGNILYGQSRDILVQCPPGQWMKGIAVNVALSYTSSYLKTDDTISAKLPNNQPRTLPQSKLSYHFLRNELCNNLAALYPVEERDQRKTIAITAIDNKKTGFDSLICLLKGNPAVASDPDVSSLLSDLIGSEVNAATPENGQVYQALQTAPVTAGVRVFKSYWEKWGRHYLASLWCAHMRQTCNSFKDPGPLRYGVNSALFKRCRDELDAAFDNLPPPKGTYRQRHTHTPRGVPLGPNANTSTVHMSRWNRASNPCFLGSCPVTLADGTETTVEDLNPGMTVANPLLAGASGSIAGMKIAAIVQTRTNPGDQVVRVGPHLWITPWHPIFDTAVGKWVFPQSVADEVRNLHSHEPVYSILLEPSSPSPTQPDAHAVEVGGIPCVTLGHGLLPPGPPRSDDDVRAHSFFGDYEAVERSLRRLTEDGRGRKLCLGIKRDERTGLVDGFMPATTTTTPEGHALEGMMSVYEGYPCSMDRGDGGLVIQRQVLGY